MTADLTALKGKRIIVTRAIHQADDLTTLLTAQGAQVLSFPCIAITPPEDTQALDEALNGLDGFDWLVVTSPNTVYALSERLNMLGITPDWDAVKIAAVGDATAEAVITYLETHVNLIPDEAYANSLADALDVKDGERVFLPQSDIARSELGHRLSTKGAIVTTITAYENTIGTGGDDVPTLLERAEVDAITFTSSSTVENFIKRLENRPQAEQFARTLPAACIGVRTSDTALEFGFTNTVTPDNPAIGTMIEALAKYFTE